MGRSQTFQNEGAARGLRGEQGGADWDSKWRLSIDLCTKCNFIWGGKRGGRVSARGDSRPPAPPPATPLLIFRTLLAKFWIFAYFLQKIAIFRSGMFLWRHNYVTPWPIVLILKCMNREGPYLLIDTKINFIGGSVGKNLGRGCNNPPG